jgi:hypothetical protein
MASCTYKNYFNEYISGELPHKLEIDFLQHLESCPVCSKCLDQYYEMHRWIHKRQRPTAHPDLINTYKTKLGETFGRQPLLSRIFDQILDVLPAPSPWWRLTTIAVILIIGVFTGRYLLQPNDAVFTPVLQVPYDWQQPISKTDVDYIGFYLSASEMILLEMENSTEMETDIFISKESAQKLLIKTFLVHETALKLKDPQLLRFLSKMELILYELANADTERIEDSITAVRLVINRAQLLDEVKLLQKVFKSQISG